MAFKFTVIFTLVAVASAGRVAVAPGLTHGSYLVASGAPTHIETYAASPVIYRSNDYEDSPAEYDFSYGVSDPDTGDQKSQVESRAGDNVHGSYSLIDADGYKRTVEYTADEQNGFNAVVRREPLVHAAPVARVTTVLAEVPVHNADEYVPATKIVADASPVHYAPAQVTYSAPAIQLSAPVVAANEHYSSHYAGSGDQYLGAGHVEASEYHH